jgi:hypothetical protein
MALIPTLPHTFVDGPGNTASGVQVMDNLNTIRDGINNTLGSTGITFPSSPRDGQIYNFHAADGSLWCFRYNASSGLSTKWEFSGGAPMIAVEAGDASGDLPGNLGPTVVIPRAGIYVIQYGHRTWHSTNAVHDTLLTLRQAGAGVTGDFAIHCQEPTSDSIKSLSTAMPLALAAGNLSLNMTSSDTQGRSRFRYIMVTPRAV